MHIQEFLDSVDFNNPEHSEQMHTVLERACEEILYMPVAHGVRGEGQLDMRQKLQRILREELTDKDREDFND